MSIPGSTVRRAAHPIDPLFLDRWSPRAMSGEPLSDAELHTLFEAARWAPSSMNFQPWRLIYARRDTPAWPAWLELLNPGNRSWAQRAAALVLFASRRNFDDGRPCPTHSFDTGAAWENLALQGTRLGLVVHGMAGFDHARARSELAIPESLHVEAMIAIGRPGDRALLSEAQQQREAPSDRRPLAQTVCEGRYTLG